MPRRESNSSIFDPRHALFLRTAPRKIYFDTWLLLAGCDLIRKLWMIEDVIILFSIIIVVLCW